jgi:hypothetical protein
MATIIRIIAGRIVHVISISCLSEIFTLKFFSFMGIIIDHIVSVVIIIITIIVWSFNMVSCSIIGEFLS